MQDFNNINLNENILKTITKLGFKQPTDIQKQVIPTMIKGRDIIGISQTGTGKTHAFLIPIIQKINFEKNQVQAVITAPTRELANQIYLQAKCFIEFIPELRVDILIGGSDRQKTINRLSTQPHIVIGTPGRIRDISLDAKALRITTASMFVIDEADMTLEFGYLEDIDMIISKMNKNIQLSVFSATIPEGIRPFLRKYLNNPKLFEIATEKVTSENVEHVLINTKHHNRYEILKNIMEIIDPYVCIIFANTRNQVRNIAKQLREDGYKVGEINGDLEPRERKQMMRRIKNMEYQYIVGTDIAARGIDIDGVSHVINLDFPNLIDFYIHRSGRCGRGKYTGICYSLYDTSNDDMIKLLQERGIYFQNKVIKDHKFVDLKEKNARNNRNHQPTELETKIQKIVSRKVKVKPGYKKKRKWKVDELVRKQRRQMIREDISKQKKERAKQAQKNKLSK